VCTENLIRVDEVAESPKLARLFDLNGAATRARNKHSSPIIAWSSVCRLAIAKDKCNACRLQKSKLLPLCSARRRGEDPLAGPDPVRDLPGLIKRSSSEYGDVA
jgi:hypothetical protein